MAIILDWTIIAIGVICAILLTINIQLSVRFVRLIEAQIKDLGATNLQAFDLVTTELRRLEKRVKQVEDAMP